MGSVCAAGVSVTSRVATECEFPTVSVNSLLMSLPGSPRRLASPQPRRGRSWARLPRWRACVSAEG